MKCGSGARLAVMLAWALVALHATGWAQEPEQPPLSLTGRILFGYARFDQSSNSQSGPAATLESDLSGYWRSPRILQFDFRPTISFGAVVPGTEMGNALTGFSAEATFLQGSSFPLRATYSRMGTSFEESGIGTGGNGVLSGVEIGTTNTVLDLDWTLRFRHVPTFRLNYRDSEYGSDLPPEFGVGNARNSRDFTAHMNYRIAGWQTSGWYRVTQSQVTFPDILDNTALQRDDTRTTDLGFSVSRLLPWHSTLGLSGDQTDAKFSFDGLSTKTKVRNANATLTSHPIERLNLTMQAQYTSNWQGYQQQTALQAAGITAGAGDPNPGSAATNASPNAPLPVPITFLLLPYDVLTIGGGGSVRLGHGFTANANVGESHSSNAEQSSNRWGAGLTYMRKWRSGWMSASYSRNSISTDSQLPTAIPGTFTMFTEDIDTNNIAVNMIQDLPRRFRLASWAQLSDGVIRDNGITYPDHDYSAQLSLTRPVGEWTLTGSFTINKNDLTRALLYNENSGKTIAMSAAYRGLSATGGYVFGSGMAMQLGDSLVWVTNPVAVTPIVGVPTLTTTSGLTLTGTYRSRRNRFMVMGNWGRFHYTTLDIAQTQYTVASIRASYALRRLRLLAGYSRQSQMFGTGPFGLFQTNLLYFQIERRFRVF